MLSPLSARRDKRPPSCWASCRGSTPPRRRTLRAPTSLVADIFREQGETARALELYELAVEQAPVPGKSVAAALTAMAEIHEEQGETQMALDLLKQALAARSGAPV